MNLYVYDLGLQGDAQADELRRVRHQVPLARPQAHRLRERRLSLPFDLATEKTARVPVVIADDMVSGRGKVVKVDSRVTNYEIGPDGKRALFGARGDVFTVPAKNGNTRNLTVTPGVHERNLQVVARRPDDRLHLRPQRHGGDLAHEPGRDGRAAPAHDRRRHLQVPDSAGRPTGRRSSGTTRCCAWPSSTSRPRRSRSRPRPRPARSSSSPGRPTAAGSPTASPRSRAGRIYLYSLDSKKTFAVDGHLVQLRRPGLQRRRQVPLLRLRPGLQSRLQLDRVEPCLPGHVPGLLRDPGQGREVAVRAEERRGGGQGREAGGPPAAKAPPADKKPAEEGGRRRPARQGGPRRPHGPHRRPAHRDGQLRPDLRRRRLRLLRQGEVPRAAARP